MIRRRRFSSSRIHRGSEGKLAGAKPRLASSKAPGLNPTFPSISASWRRASHASLPSNSTAACASEKSHATTADHPSRRILWGSSFTARRDRVLDAIEKQALK
eukprot:scaffold895_cov315-Pinguiococcus_pyrenoidosus.AAC.66